MRGIDDKLRMQKQTYIFSIADSAEAFLAAPMIRKVHLRCVLYAQNIAAFHASPNSPPFRIKHFLMCYIFVTTQHPKPF